MLKNIKFNNLLINKELLQYLNYKIHTYSILAQKL